MAIVPGIGIFVVAALGPLIHRLQQVDLVVRPDPGPLKTWVRPNAVIPVFSMKYFTAILPGSPARENRTQLHQHELRG